MAARHLQLCQRPVGQGIEGPDGWGDHHNHNRTPQSNSQPQLPDREGITECNRLTQSLPVMPENFTGAPIFNDNCICGARFFDRDNKPISVGEALALYRDSRYRVVAADTVRDGSARITTSWLAADYADNDPPQIFATQIHDGPFHGRHVRYGSEDDARRGHARALVQLIAGQVPWFIR